MSGDLIVNDDSNDGLVDVFDDNYVDFIKALITFSLNFDKNEINYSFPRLMDSSGQPLVLQPSLFPMVWPTIYFALDNESVSLVPNQLRPHLRWKLSSITANTMKSIVVRSGFRLLKDRTSKTYKTWSAIWCKHMKCSEFRIIKDYQKVNHFPGSFHFGRKDKLWQNLRAMAVKHDMQSFGVFHPQTFILPQDLHLLKKYWDNSQDELVFILKPPASARGQGISIISKFDEIPKASRTKAKPNAKSSLIVQKYITNPCLLDNGTKFDLRVYVLITSLTPLRVYLYDDGLVRFASHKYSNDGNDLSNQFIHLTNYSVNKNNLNYVANHDTEGQTGNKWTLKTLWKYLSRSSKDVDIDRIRDSIEDMILKTVISAEPHVSKLVSQHVKNRYSCFELLGFDIMLDNGYKPWLIEVNISPSLRSDSSLDSAVKSQLIKDMLNIIGYQIPPKFRNFESFGDFICLNRHYYSYTLTDEEKLKRHKYETSFVNNGFAETHDMITNLTDYDIKQLIESEDELSRVGNFKRLFPSDKTRQYLHFFDRLSYSNLLLDEWEQQYWDNREKGIEKLRSLLSGKQYLFYSQTNSINRILKNHNFDILDDNLVIDK